MTLSTESVVEWRKIDPVSRLGDWLLELLNDSCSQEPYERESGWEFDAL